MTDTPFVAFATVTIATPAADTGSLPAGRHVAALAMLVAERGGDGAWRFDLRAHAVPAGAGEDRLLEWATLAMPERGIAIGWQLADAIVTPLLDAARDGEPEIARAFLARLYGLVTAPSVDLAIAHGGGAAPPFASVAAARGIVAPAMTPGEAFTAWSFGDVDRLADHAAGIALATWALWLAEANGTATTVAQAYAAWRRA